MATAFKAVPAMTPTDKPVHMTQFCGPAVAGNQSPMRMQFTVGDQFVSMSRDQVVAAVAAMTEWVAGTRERE